MKMLLTFALLSIVVGCGVNDARTKDTWSGATVAPASVTGAVPAKAVRPPSWCADGGGCPLGLVCGDDGVCGTLCGADFVCPIGWYCYSDGPAHKFRDCLPASSCIYADGGC
jgi:hypothetical protein